MFELVMSAPYLKCTRVNTNGNEKEKVMSTTLEAIPSAVVAEEEEHLDPKRWRALFILLFAGFMDLVDATVVNVAIPSIQRDLGITYSAVQWVVAGYSLAFALVLITGGRLGDIIGRKRMFMIGVGGFVLASTLCGLAVSQEMLVAARLLQGGMAALMIPQVLSIIQVTFPMRERGAAFGMFGGLAGLAASVGPLIGGLLIKADLFGLDWRPIFLVNVPVGLITIVAAFFLVRESKSSHAPRLDLVGVGIVTVALLLLLYPLVQGRDLGWPIWTFISMAASLPVFILFVFYERYKTRLDGSPLVILEMFKKRSFVAGLLVSLVFIAGIGSFFLPFALYLQIGLGYSALHAALTGLPWSLGTAIFAGTSMRFVPRFGGRKLIQAGLVIMAVGVLGYMLTLNLFGTEINSWEMIPALFVAGLGMGLVFGPLADITLSNIEGHQAGSASGVSNTIQQLGGALGIAIIGVIFFSLLADRAVPSAQAVAPQISSGLQSTGLPAVAQAGIVSGFQSCFHDRMAESDPSAVPPSCQQPSGSSNSSTASQAVSQQVGTVVASAATEALKRDFTSTMLTTMWFHIGIYTLSFILTFFLPLKTRPNPEALPV